MTGVSNDNPVSTEKVESGDSELLGFLGQVEGGDLPPDKVDDTLLTKWAKAETDSNRGASRWAFHLGRVLLHERSRLKHGQVTQWQNTRAEMLGRKPRTLRRYLLVAECLQSEIGPRCPISILDLPLKQIPVAVRNIGEGRNWDEGPPIDRSDDAQKSRWLKRADGLIQSAYRLPDGTALLRDLRAKVQEALDTLGDEVTAQDYTQVTSDFLHKQAQNLPRQSLVQPVICYPGGKYGAVDRLTEILFWMANKPPRVDRIYREPFLGGGSVVLNLLRRGIVDQVWLNDRDPSVAALWNAVIRQPDELRIRLIEAPRTADYVVECMSALDSDSLTGLDLAVAKIIAHVCTKEGKGPMAKSPSPIKIRKWRPEAYSKRYLTAHNLLRGRVIHGECTCLNGAEVIASPGEALIYADPPYHRHGKEFYRFHFGPEDHRRLAEALLCSNQPWLLSYGQHGDEMIRGLYKEVHVETVHLSYGNNKARFREELLICPTECAGALSPGSPNLLMELFGPASNGNGIVTP